MLILEVKTENLGKTSSFLPNTAESPKASTKASKLLNPLSKDEKVPDFQMKRIKPRFKGIVVLIPVKGHHQAIQDINEQLATLRSKKCSLGFHKGFIGRFMTFSELPTPEY